MWRHLHVFIVSVQNAVFICFQHPSPSVWGPALTKLVKRARVSMTMRAKTQAVSRVLEKNWVCYLYGGQKKKTGQTSWANQRGPLISHIQSEYAICSKIAEKRDWRGPRQSANCIAYSFLAEDVNRREEKEKNERKKRRETNFYRE